MRKQLITLSKCQLKIVIMTVLWAVFNSPTASADRIRSTTQLFSERTDPGQSWDASASAKYQRHDGEWVHVGEGEEFPSDYNNINAHDDDPTMPPPNLSMPGQSNWRHDVQIDLYSAGTRWSADTWEGSNEWGSVTGPGVSTNTGVAVDLRYTGDNFWDTSLRVMANAGADAYLAKVYTDLSETWGAEDTNVSAGASGNASVGASAKARGAIDINRNRMDVTSNANALLGAKALGKLKAAAQLCYLMVESILRGDASAGIGGHIGGTFKVEWSQLKVQVAGNIGATLGLGAGAGANVIVDLSELANDKQKVFDCLKNRLGQLKDAAVAGGQSLVSAAGEALQNGGNWAYDQFVKAKDAVDSMTVDVVDELLNWLNTPDVCGIL